MYVKSRNYTPMCIFFFFARIPLIQLQHSLNLDHFHPTFPHWTITDQFFSCQKDGYGLPSFNRTFPWVDKPHLERRHISPTNWPLRCTASKNEQGSTKKMLGLRSETSDKGIWGRKRCPLCREIKRLSG